MLRAIAGLWSFGKGTITFYDTNTKDSLPCLPETIASSEIAIVDKTKPECNILEKRNPRGVFFLPQKPYMVLGTLRQQLLYPTWSDAIAPDSDSDNPNGKSFFIMLLLLLNGSSLHEICGCQLT